MLYRNKLEDTIKKYIENKNLECWLTITFPTAVPACLAKKRFQHFFKKLNKASEEFFKKYTECLVFIERNKYRAGVHIHALASGIPPSLYSSLNKRCEEHFGECEIKARHEGVVSYLIKKFDSGLLEDWFPLIINSKFRGLPPP